MNIEKSEGLFAGCKVLWRSRWRLADKQDIVTNSLRNLARIRIEWLWHIISTWKKKEKKSEKLGGAVTSCAAGRISGLAALNASMRATPSAFSFPMNGDVNKKEEKKGGKKKKAGGKRDIEKAKASKVSHRRKVDVYTEVMEVMLRLLDVLWVYLLEIRDGNNITRLSTSWIGW